MSIPLAFSAAHISKWDSLPRVPERTTRSSVDDQSSVPDHNPRRTTLRKNETAGRTDDSVATEAPVSHGNAYLYRLSGISCPLFVSLCVVFNSFSFRGTDNMTVKTHTWITLWFLLSLPVVLWDVGYCFSRPRSMVGGDLHWIWKPYGLYQDIDYVYGTKALEENNGFTNAQSLLNLVETSLNVAYVYHTHVSSWPGAPLVGFASATMTLSKTLLYFAQEYYCSWCSVRHNTLGDLIFLYLLPNGFWIVFPAMIVWRLGRDIVGSLSQVSALQRISRAASKRSQ